MVGKLLTNDEMASSGESWSDDDVRTAVSSFLDDFSIEATPHASGEVDAYPEYLPTGTSVYIAHPPKSSLDDVVQLATRLCKLGYRPIPHLIARKFQSRQQLDRTLGQLHDIGIDQALLIAGDLPRPLGPYHCVMNILETGLLPHHGFQNVGIAGHPEGSRVIGPTVLRRALAEKANWGAETGLTMYIVTQFGFDAQAVIDWEATVSAAGIGLPIHVGMAGKAPLKQLLRYAMRCGVTTSMRMLLGKASAMSENINLATADELVLAFARHRLAHTNCRMARAHFFAFGGAEATARWINAIRSGQFKIRRDRLVMEIMS